MFRFSIARAAGRFRRDAAGTLIIMAAALLPVLLSAAALAVDIGSLYLERRQAQGAADLAAMAGAADIDRAEAAVTATLKANGIEQTTALTIVKGQYQPDVSLQPTQRFRPGVTPYNAVRVELTKPGRLFFANAFRVTPVQLGVKAVAANASLATFSIGSRLAAVRDGLLNAVTSALLGTSVNLSVMDYNALISADVKIASFLDALATELHLTGASYSDVLNASMTTGNVLKAAAAVANQDGNSAAASALLKLSSQAGNTALRAPLSSVLDVGPYGTASIGQSPPGLDAGISLMDLVNGTASLANGTNQVALNLGAEVPGLLSLKVDLSIGERAQQSPEVAVGQPGATIYTAQTRLRIVAEVGGTGLLAGVRVRLPIGIDAAYARGTLASVTCSGSDSKQSAHATIAARPGIVRAWIGETALSSMGDFRSAPSVSAARIVDTSLIKVTGRADVSATNTSDTMLEFTQTDVDNRTIKRTETVNITQTLVTSLLRNLSLDVQVGGLGIGLPGVVGQLVAKILGTVATPLDQVVSALLTSLGIHLGEADIRVHGISCGASVLAG